MLSAFFPSTRSTPRPIRLNSTLVAIPDEARVHQQLTSLRESLTNARRELNSTALALQRESWTARSVPTLQGQLRQAHTQLAMLQQEHRRGSSRLRDTEVQKEGQQRSMLKLRSEFSAVQAELRRHREEVKLEKLLAHRAAEDSAHGWALLLLLLLLLLPIAGVLVTRRRQRQASRPTLHLPNLIAAHTRTIHTLVLRVPAQQGAEKTDGGPLPI